MTAIFKATIDIYLEASAEGEACDAVAETLRPLLKRYTPDSCILDWQYNPAHAYPDIATEAEINALEQ